MQDWVVTLAGLALLGGIYGAWHLVLEAPLRRIFSPPAGGWVLLGTWGLACSAIPVALSWRNSHPYIGGTVAVLAVPLALFLTLVYRDQRRVVAGLPPATVDVPRRLGPVSRAIWGSLAVAIIALAIYLFFTSHDTWHEALAVGSVGSSLLGIAWSGAVPQSLRERLGAPPDPPQLA